MHDLVVLRWTRRRLHSGHSGPHKIDSAFLFSRLFRDERTLKCAAEAGSPVIYSALIQSKN
jgi:hypothetical protein